MSVCNLHQLPHLTIFPHVLITIPNLRTPNVALIGVMINNLSRYSCRRPIITRYGVLISGRGQSTKRPHNGIDLCTDRIAPARTDRVRRPIRLTEVCREGCICSGLLRMMGCSWELDTTDSLYQVRSLCYPISPMPSVYHPGSSTYKITIDFTIAYELVS
jgi:hypothetical protein